MKSSLSWSEDLDNSVHLSESCKQPLYLMHVCDLDCKQRVGGSGLTRREVKTYYFKIVVVANL